MSAAISYPTLTNAVTLFATVDAANAFFSSFVVGSAGTSTEGVVKQASFPSAIGTTVTLTATTVTVLNEDGSTSSYQVCSYADIVALLALVNELKTQINAIRSAMISAGQAV